ncbi:MAG: DUF2730 family protein [Thermodesulfobacteriota bacterium]
MPVWLKDWWPVLALLVNGLAVWVMWSMSRKFMTREDCARCAGNITARVETLEKQKTCVDIKLDNLPQMEALHQIALRLEELAGDQEALKATIDGLRDLLRRVEHPLNLLLEGHLNGKRRSE